MDNNIPTDPIDEYPNIRDHKKRVSDFDRLYKIVTQCMREYIENHTGSLLPEDTEWLEGLIIGFEERYNNWIENEKQYLDNLYKERLRPFWFFGHMYLHVSYDLSVCISESFGEISGNKNKVIDRRNYIFNDLKTVFINALKDPSNSWFLNPKIIHFFELEGYIITTLVGMRAKTWENARLLAGMDDDARSVIMPIFHESVTQTMINAREKRWIWSRFLSFIPPDINISHLEKFLSVLIFFFILLNSSFVHAVETLGLIKLFSGDRLKKWVASQVADEMSIFTPVDIGQIYEQLYPSDLDEEGNVVDK